jgi:plastocyanin
VITVFALDGPKRSPLPPLTAVVDQVKLAFAPDLTVIPVGSTVEFPNSDATSHQVYSFSPTHRFQLPLYRGKPYPPVVFDQPGLITLGCNIHDDMLGYVVVTDAQYFGQTNSSGAWMAPNIPAGRYRVEIWHPRLREPAATLTKEVVVTDAQSAEVAILLNRPLRPAPLTDRPHSWDAY